MALFHVYVEGAVDPSPAATKRLAEMMSSRYGLSVADVTARLAKGRFRVKANVDRATADVYLRDLGAVGAKVAIEEARAQTSPSIQAVTATPPAGVRAATEPPKRPTPEPPPRAQSSPAIPMTSGLAAAFGSSTSGSQDLGVLGGDSGSFALSSVDGNEMGLPGDDAFTPPPPQSSASLPASIGPATAPPRVARPRISTPPPTDAFAPPDAEDENQKVEIATDEIAAKEARKRASVPPPNTPVLQRKTGTSIPPQNAPPPVTSLPTIRGRLGPLSDVRIRFAAGVLAAVLIGFVPAHIIATFRETSAYKDIDTKYLTAASNAPDPGSWAALDEPAMRDKRSAQKGILWSSLLVWALFAGGVGYVWFKRVPWDALDRPRST